MTNQELVSRGIAVIPAGASNMGSLMHRGIYVKSGRGARVTDVEGKSYLDFVNNWTAIIHGHAHPAIVEASIAQLHAAAPTNLPSEPELQLAELLCARIASVERVKFNNSGTAAGMMAAKAARAFTGRTRLAKAEGVYHGSYDPLEVSSLSAGPDNWGESDSPRGVPLNAGTPPGVVENVVVLPFNDCANTERLLRAHGAELAAVFVDLMPGRGGIPATPEWLELVRRVSTEIGALLVFDEVITFRLERGGFQQRYAVKPDLTMLGKIIGGGSLPVGAVGGRADVMAVFGPKVPMWGTFTANAITMAAGLAAMELLDQPCLDRLTALGDRVRAGVGKAFADTGYEGQVSGTGSLFNLHLHARPLTGFRSFRAMDKREVEDNAAMQQHLLGAGILMGGVGGSVNAAMTDADVDFLVETYRAGLEKLLHARAPKTT